MLSIENDLDVITLSDDENITELTDNNELEVAIYTCTSSGILPSFNSGFTYTHNEVYNGDGTYTTTIIANSLDNLPTSISFSGKATLLTVDKLNTSKVTNMASMFNGCSKLTSLDVSGFDTSKVLNMGNMFNGCNNLTSLDVSGFDTSKVTYMDNMFYGCSNLTSLDVSGFDTSNVIYMYNMFQNCSKLTSLDVSGFDTGNVIYMYNMFYNCVNLTSLDLSGFDTGKVTSMASMFLNCHNLTSLDVSGFDTSKVTNMASMFNGCSKLTSLDVSGFDTSKVTNMYNMFGNCTSLKALRLLGWSPAEVERVVAILPTVTPTSTVYGSLLIDETLLPSGWVYDSELEIARYTCTSSGVLPSFNSGFTYTYDEIDNGDGTYTIEVYADSLDNLPTKISFTANNNLLTVDKLNTSKATSMLQMFRSCGNLTRINCKLDTSSVTNEISQIFIGCSKLEYVDATNLVGSNIKYASSLFSSCPSLKQIDGLNTWDTSSVTNMSNMFSGCHSLTTLDLSNWDMSKVTNKSSVFSNCRTLHSITCNNLNTIIALSDELPTRTSDGQGEIVTEVHRKMSADLKSTLSSKHWTVTELPYVVLKYKFNHKLYANLLPALNSSFNDYTILDEVNNKDGVTIRSIKSLSPPTSIRFGTPSNTIQDQQQCLLEVLDLDTSEVTNMNNMFSCCTNLISVSSDWNTGKASDMSRMFYNCPSLASLDVSNFDTSKVTTIAYMFWGCSSLDMIDVSSWDVGKVSNMQSMFEGCSLISELDVSNWNVGSLTNMACMLQNCLSLSKLNVANWKPNNVININNMFNNCKSLTTLDANNWNISKATSFDNLFAGCTSLVRVNLSNWNTSSVTSLGGTFANCTSLVEADLSNWNTSKNTNMATMFYNCTSLESIIGLDGFDTRSVSNMKNVFQNCQSLTTLDLSNFDTTNGNCREIFRDCRNLSKIGMLYCNKKTVNDLITQIKSINTSLKKEIYLIDVEPSEMEVINNITYHKGVNHEEEILLPCQLMKVGNYKDRLYYDKDNGKYFIEKNVGKITTDELISHGASTEYHANHASSYVDPENTMMAQFRKGNLFMNIDIIPVISTTLPSIQTYNDTKLNTEGVYTRFGGNLVVRIKCKKIHDKGIDFSSDTPPLASVVNNAFKEWMIENPADFYYASASPQLIEVKNLDKIIIPSSDENNLSTISVKSNDHIGATDINLKTNSIRYNPLRLSTNTLYTLQLDSIPSNIKTISANLGGTVKSIDVSTNNHCSIEITTPSTLTTDNLELIGEGIKVSNVMLFNGKPNQNPEYVDGIQSIGELQENGKYKIDIQTKTDVLYEEEYEMTDKLVIEDTKDIGHVRVDKIIGNSLVNLLLDPYVTDFKYGNVNDYTWGNTGTSTIQNGVVTHTGTTGITGYTRQKVAVKPNTSYYGFARVKLNYTGENLDKCNFGVCINGERAWSPSNTYILSRDKVTSNTNGYVEVSCRIDNVDHTHLMFSLDCSGIIGEVSFKDFYMIELPSNELYPTTSWEGLKSTFEEGLVTQEQVDNRQELEENLDKYKADIKVTGKNKYSFDKLTRVVNTSDYFIQLTPNTTYHIKGYVDEALISDRPYVSLYANGINIGWVHLGIKQYIDNTFTTGDDGQVRFWCSDRKIIMEYLEVGAIKFQIEEGSLATNYQQYYEETQSIYLNSPLLKGDEIVMKDGELCHYHKMGKVTLNGSENWGVHIQGTNCYSLSFTGASSSQSNALSNRMKVSTSYKTDSDSLVIEATRIIYTETKAGISPTEATHLKVPKLKAYLQENPLVIIYELAEPYYEPLNQNQISIDTPNSKSYVSINSLIPTQNANVTYLEYGICNNSIELDEPLRAIGNVRDKLYWDWYEGKYVLERNIGETVLDGSESWYNMGMNFPTPIFSFNNSGLKVPTSNTDHICNTLPARSFSTTQYDYKCIYLNGQNDSIRIQLPVNSVDEFKQWLQANPTKLVYKLATPTKEYISLPKQNTKSFAPVTYLTMPNIPLKTDISIDTDIQKYRPIGLSANTKYTVFLDSVGDNDIKVELGGKIETITPSMEHGQNKVIITTPSTLSHNDLYVSGAGSNVKNVMLMQNEITQSPEYIDSIQSVGENVENEHLGTVVALGEGNKYKNIFINEIHGDTYKGSSLGELIVDEFGDPVLDDNGDKQYTFKIKISNHPFGKGGRI